MAISLDHNQIKYTLFILYIINQLNDNHCQDVNLFVRCKYYILMLDVKA